MARRKCKYGKRIKKKCPTKAQAKARAQRKRGFKSPVTGRVFRSKRQYLQWLDMRRTDRARADS